MYLTLNRHFPAVGLSPLPCRIGLHLKTNLQASGTIRAKNSHHSLEQRTSEDERRSYHGRKDTFLPKVKMLLEGMIERGFNCKTDVVENLGHEFPADFDRRLESATNFLLG